jgi:addiction module HigA family antidote
MSVNVTHPGVTLWDDYMSPRGITKAQLARVLRVPRSVVYAVVRGDKNIDADLALRLSDYFSDTTANFWMNLQTEYDLDIARERMGSPLSKKVKFLSCDKGPCHDFAHIYTDGGCRSNPGGPTSYGFVILGANDAILREGSGQLGGGTSNTAEYGAVIKAMLAARDLGLKDIEVVTDSKLIVEQISGRYGIKAEALYKLCQQVKKLAKEFRAFKIAWAPRRSNVALMRADDLTQIAFDRY